AVTHRAASINARITAHHAPSPAHGLRVHTQQLTVFLFGNAVRSRTCVLLLPSWWPRANTRLLLTLHPENWLPDLDSHQDKRFNRPPCYFDTTWQWRCRQEFHLHRSV